MPETQDWWKSRLLIFSRIFFISLGVSSDTLQNPLIFSSLLIFAKCEQINVAGYSLTVFLSWINYPRYTRQQFSFLSLYTFRRFIKFRENIIIELELLTREFYKILKFEYRWSSKREYKIRKVWWTNWLIQIFSKFSIVRKMERKDSKRFLKCEFFHIRFNLNFNHKLNIITNRILKLEIWWNYFWYFMLTIKKNYNFNHNLQYSVFFWKDTNYSIKKLYFKLFEE